MQRPRGRAVQAAFRKWKGGKSRCNVLNKASSQLSQAQHHASTLRFLQGERVALTAVTQQALLRSGLDKSFRCSDSGHAAVTSGKGVLPGLECSPDPGFSRLSGRGSCHFPVVPQLTAHFGGVSIRPPSAPRALSLPPKRCSQDHVTLLGSPELRAGQVQAACVVGGPHSPLCGEGTGGSRANAGQCALWALAYTRGERTWHLLHALPLYGLGSWNGYLGSLVPGVVSAETDRHLSGDGSIALMQIPHLLVYEHHAHGSDPLDECSLHTRALGWSAACSFSSACFLLFLY